MRQGLPEKLASFAGCSLQDVMPTIERTMRSYGHPMPARDVAARWDEINQGLNDSVVTATDANITPNPIGRASGR